MNVSTEAFFEIFQRGTSNVRWCEDVLVEAGGVGRHQLFIAEFYNTISNGAFMLAAIAGLVRVFSEKKRPLNFGACIFLESIMLVGVGCGSTWFHAHQSLFAQYTDEFPMSLLMLAYNYNMIGLHPLSTNPKYSWKFNTIVHAVVAGFWILYVCIDIHEVFLTCFGLQLVLSLSLTFDAGRRVGHKPDTWWLSVAALVFGKSMWELERHRFRNDSCDAPGTLLLHPLWHLGAALSHYLSVYNISQLEKKVRAKKEGKKTL